MFTRMSLLSDVVQILWIYHYRYTDGQPVDTNPLIINTDRPFRDTVYEVEDYACGNFCNSSIAKYPYGNCFDCKPCKCDKTCFYFGDCCPDLLFLHSTQQSIPSSPHVSCEKRYPIWQKETTEPYMFVVTKCPDEFAAGDSVKTKCETAIVSDLEQAQPVSSVQTQLTYRNKFCAVCHGVTLHQLWGFRVECRNTDSLNSASDKNGLWKLVLDEPTCKIENFPPNGVNIRNCFGDQIERCNVSGRWETKIENIETLCGMYNHPVKYANSLYKNVFCAVCNGPQFCDRYQHDAPRDSLTTLDPVEKTYPLSVLIDFNPKLKLLDLEEKLPEVEKKCDETKTYNPFSGQCEKLSCPPRRILSDGVCETFYASTKGLGHSFSMIVKFSEKLNQSDWFVLPGQYQERLRQEFAMYRPFVFSSLDMAGYRSAPEIEDDKGLDSFTEVITRMKVSGRMVSASNRTLVEMEESIHAVQAISFSMDVGLKNVTLTSVPVVCSDRLEGLPEGEPWLGFIAGRPEELLCYDDCLADVIYEPVQHTLDCPYLEFNLTTSNFTFDVDNLSVVFNNQNINLNSSGYVICEENLKLCSAVLQHIQNEIADFLSSGTFPEEGATKALTVVSIICNALSLLCLLITLLIYCILPQLRTLPGKNTMALIIHLFCAQFFFQVGIRMTYNEGVCRAMGVLIHYLWMSSFAWMGMCAYLMYSVFTQMAANTFFRRTDETKKMVRSFAGCNGSAAVVVLACIVYHLATSQGERIGYGGRICFLDEPVDIGIFFASPLGVVLILNTFCFIRTAMAIRSGPDMTNATNRDNRNHMLVYVRLSVLLGFTWIFGFIAEAIQSQPLRYVFVILTGLQGVFIFIAYCVNRRIWDMLSKRNERKVTVKFTAGDRIRNTVPDTISTDL